MRKRILLGVISLLLLGGLAFLPTANLYAEDSSGVEVNEASSLGTENAGSSEAGVQISLSPVSKVLQLSSNSVYDEEFTVNNDGSRELEVEVFAAPYSYVYSEDLDTYQLGFSNENHFTQISRWISFKDNDGNYAKTINTTIPPHGSTTISFRVTTPDNIPAGGQYAVVFARTTNGPIGSNGIKTEASPGLVIYGRSSEGEIIAKAEISSLNISQTKVEGNTIRDLINATAKIKNDGNVDISAVGKLTIDGVLGGGHYETPSDRGRISVIPEAELVVSDSWEETPGFGLFKVTWTVTVGDHTETIEQFVVINILPAIIVAIIVLTIIIAGCIILIKKRKERRSRLSV